MANKITLLFLRRFCCVRDYLVYGHPFVDDMVRNRCSNLTVIWVLPFSDLLFAFQIFPLVRNRLEGMPFVATMFGGGPPWVHHDVSGADCEAAGLTLVPPDYTCGNAASALQFASCFLLVGLLIVISLCGLVGTYGLDLLGNSGGKSAAEGYHKWLNPDARKL